MLISTLNYNQPELTDNLVKQLRHDVTFNSHELMVVDNGSTEVPANTTTHKFKFVTASMATNTKLNGSSTSSRTGFVVIRLGDT